MRLALLTLMATTACTSEMSDDDIEPANLWGFGALDAVQSQIAAYRRATRR